MISLEFWRYELISRDFDESLFNSMEREYLNDLHRKRLRKSKGDNSIAPRRKKEPNAVRTISKQRCNRRVIGASKRI